MTICHYFWSTLKNINLYKSNITVAIWKAGMPKIQMAQEYKSGFFLLWCSPKTLGHDVILYAVWKLIREY